MPLSLSLLNVEKKDPIQNVKDKYKGKQMQYEEIKNKEDEQHANSVDSECKISMFQSDRLSETVNSIDGIGQQINTDQDDGDQINQDDENKSQKGANDNLTINI